MTAYQRGSYPAFEELYARHSGRVLGYLRKHLLDTAEAEDLMQATFLRLHHSRAQYDPTLPFLPWLFAICRNGLTDLHRKKKAVVVSPEFLDQVVKPEEEDLRSVEATLADSLTHLTLEQRRLLKLRFEEGLSFEEISRKMGLASPTLRKRVSRAIARLRENFGRREKKAGQL